MSTTQKTIMLTQDLHNWVENQIKSGRFCDDNDFFKQLIEQNKAFSLQEEVINAALAQGEQSGTPQPFDCDKFKKKMLEKHAEKIR